MAKISDFIEKAEKLYNSGANKPEFKAWKNDVIQFLKRMFGDDSNEVATFNNIEFITYYLTFDIFNVFWKEHILKEKETFQKGLKNAIFYLKNYESDNIIDFIDIIDKTQINTDKISNKKNIFIVHGSNDRVKEQVANFIISLGIEPIILNEQLTKGQTIIEKFEEYSNVKMAIVIFTSYELNNFNVDSEYEKRTSQNMIFEAGYFLGKLGKKNSIILLEQGLSIPSIFNGYTYFEIDQEERWKLDIAKKLKKIS